MCTFDLKEHLAHFLSIHLPEGFPVLVGFSGGIDSFSLLHALQGQRRRIVAVHVDHGWRPESSEEEAYLRDRVAQMGLEYRSYRLSEAPSGENLEDWSRVQRYACFKKASEACSIDTIILAHQADDQVETVVKRFLEGASLMRLRGMKPVDHRDGLTILRPLLNVPRKDLEYYVRSCGIEHIEDPSNADVSYLRPRLRHVIIPFLEDTFGKKIKKSILSLSDEARELESYLQEELQNSFEFFEAPNGILAMAKKCGENRHLVRFLMRRLITMQGFAPLSRHQLDRAVTVFSSKDTEPVRFFTKHNGLFVQGGIAFASRADALDMEPVICSTEEGTVRAGMLDISWREEIFEEHRNVAWQSFFSGGECQICIPKEPFVIRATTSALLSKIKEKLDSPALLRTLIPGIVQSFRLVGDFLTGYTTPLNRGDNCFKLSAKIAKGFREPFVKLETLPARGGTE